MRYHLLVAAAMLFGCPSPGLHVGLTGVKSQQGYAYNTEQPCIHAAETTRIADRVLVLSLHELTKAGYVKSYHDAAKKVRNGTVNVCLIEKPEKCSSGGWTRGPFGPKLPGQKYPLAARKRGCATIWTAWASICWPPVCRKEWPDEPHCVKAGESKSNGWENGLIHELFNVARARFANVHQADYSKLPKLFGKDGVKSKVVAAYKAAGYHDWPVFLPATCK
jgi:hypothetical protein